jgi:protocatechuate 3,4-dioxygenase beta subunit
MRSVFILSLLLLDSASSVCQPVPQSSSERIDVPKENATVAGSVFRIDNGEPLKKARVNLQTHTTGAFSDFFLTDEQGHFLFDNVPPGSYELQVSRNGFVDAQYGQKKPGAPGAIFTLVSGQRITDLVFKLARAASLSGHVFDEDGEPISRAEVIAYRASGHSGTEQRAGDDRMFTNDLGEFRVFDLAPGRYFLAVNYRIQDHSGLTSKEERQRFNPGYLPTYYPNTTDPGKAQAISVSPGDEIRSIDFMLRPAHLVTVSGKVITNIPTPSGANAGGAVRLEPCNPGLADASPELYDFQHKDGSFSIHNVPPGSYELVANWQDPPGQEWHRVARPLDVGSYDIENVVLIISRGVDIAGHVIWEGSAPSDSAVMLHLQAVDEREFLIQPQRIKADGTFQFKGVPEGTYRIELLEQGPTGNFYLKAARYGSASVVDVDFPVQPGTDAYLEVILSSRAAQVRGMVANSDSVPAVGAKVVIIPDPPHRDQKYRYLSATTDQNGSFSMTGISPGDYKLFSWDSVEESESRYGEDWFDLNWLKPYETEGQSLHFEEGDQRSINLKLIESKTDSP